MLKQPNRVAGGLMGWVDMRRFGMAGGGGSSAEKSPTPLVADMVEMG